MKLAGSSVDHAVTSEQMRSLDLAASENYGIPSLLLMENAGRAVAEAAREMLGDLRGKSIVIAAGPGNNGGDGFVAARHVANALGVPWIHYFGDRKTARGDSLANIDIAERMGIDIIESDLDRFRAYCQNADLIIDALLGTGTKGDLRDPYPAVIDAINESACPVLAVDIPSGVNADTGAVTGRAVAADRTVTFGLPKIGLLTGAGAACSGQVTVADIGIPLQAVVKANLNTVVPDGWDVAQRLPPRRADSHKGDFGHLAVVAGSAGLTGAATLAAEGALRIGAGLVTLLVPESLNDIFEAKLTEAMTIPVAEGKARAFGMASLGKVLEYTGRWDAAVIGPGFGRDEDTIEFTLELIRRLERPAIVDADALFAISKDLSVLRDCRSPLIITPHPGEMATLLGTTAAEVQSNRLEVARGFAAEHEVTVVLKGAGTVIADPDGTACINTTGTPGMASGGTGDVLSGMIGGLLAQWHAHESRVEPLDAACAAVYLHGRAGEIAAEEFGEAAMIASDVANHIGDAMTEVL